MAARQPIAKDIDEFIGRYPVDVQAILEKVRAIVREAAPEAVEDIRYGIPTFRLNNTNLVHFSAFPNHIGFYPTPGGIEKFQDELAPYAGAKGSVQFPMSQPIPYELISRIVAFRVDEVRQKSAGKRRKK